MCSDISIHSCQTPGISKHSNGLLFFTLQLGYGQLPDGAELSKQSLEAAKRFRTLQFIVESTIETLGPGGGPTKATSEAFTTMQNPGKFAIESKAMGISTLIVSNSEAIYMYMPVRHEYARSRLGWTRCPHG